MALAVNGQVRGPGEQLGSDPELWPADAYKKLLSEPSNGLALLLLLLNSPKWVHRRCESVTFHDERTVARRVSVDFTVPALAPDVLSPWEQGRGVAKLSAEGARCYDTYARAEKDNGYDRPAMIVASSEGQHRDDSRWTNRMERDMADRLQEAVMAARDAAPPRLVPS